MNLAACICHLYPFANRTDFRISMVGGIQTVTEWNEKVLGPKPSDDNLFAAWPDVVAVQEKKQLSISITAKIETIFRDEFSDVSKAVMAATFAGLLALVKSGELVAGKLLVENVTTVPPGVTQERFDEVKAMLIALFP